jgi:hypothetical protein
MLSPLNKRIINIDVSVNITHCYHVSVKLIIGLTIAQFEGEFYASRLLEECKLLNLAFSMTKSSTLQKKSNFVSW